MSLRRQAREIALQVLFQDEFIENPDRKSQLEYFKKSFDVTAEVWNYAEVLLNGVAAKSESIEQTIQSYSKNWSSTRIALVDKNILRIAIFEILFLKEEIPMKVATNEAIEISKKYSSTDSHQFINGILGQIIEDETA